MCLHGDGYEDAREFWAMLKALRKFPDLDENGREVFGRVRSDNTILDIRRRGRIKIEVKEICHRVREFNH
jgi:hypothetical protein